MLLAILPFFIQLMACVRASISLPKRQEEPEIGVRKVNGAASEW
jgi:hypothetical protein